MTTSIREIKATDVGVPVDFYANADLTDADVEVVAHDLFAGTSTVLTVGNLRVEDGQTIVTYLTDGTLAPSEYECELVAVRGLAVAHFPDDVASRPRLIVHPSIP